MHLRTIHGIRRVTSVGVVTTAPYHIHDELAASEAAVGPRRIDESQDENGDTDPMTVLM